MLAIMIEDGEQHCVYENEAAKPYDDGHGVHCMAGPKNKIHSISELLKKNLGKYILFFSAKQTTSLEFVAGADGITAKKFSDG